jgi:hypothetical protein
MTPDDLDRILSSQDDLEPSSGFANKVMAAACRLDAEPPALTFPWFRFAAGVAASVVMAAAGTVLLLRSGPVLISVTAPLAPLAAVAPEFGYATAAVLLSLGFASLPRLFARL